MKCVVAKHINGISLNDFEYLLDALDGAIKVFEDKKQTIQHLVQLGLLEGEMDNLLFLDFERLQNGEFEEVSYL